jgi:hypothetical protein
MGQLMMPLAVIIASVILAATILNSARMIAGAIARLTSKEPANGAFPYSSQAMPQSAAGYPVEPSGVPIQPETHLDVGSNVLASFEGRWWRAEVTDLVGEEHVRIHYTSWDPVWDESVPKSSLQVDLSGAVPD